MGKQNQTLSSDSLATYYNATIDHIQTIAQRSGRALDDITLIAVTKNQSVEAIERLYELGHRDFGENRVAEASSKIALLSAQLQSNPSPPIWHMIGHIQSRKARTSVSLFNMIHSVDTIKLAKRLSRFAVESDTTASILLQCNVSGEHTKSGFDASDTAHNTSQWSDLVNSISQIVALPNLKVAGLMTMAPITNEPETSRPIFRNLRILKDKISQRFPRSSMKHLSMGMSADYAIAIQEGATMLRIGTSIFGHRNTK
ncbi:MAG: YggS family pyridoxal phosphate-dependent enzyme [Anaerolineales bacterium]|nr:YggS family pyridoxal phosphate-dependent enzyme [Anaerolineales bacterium]